MRGRKPGAIYSGSSPIIRVPSAPSWLNDDAKKEWKRVAPILIEERKTLTMADLATFANYCSAVGDIMAAESLIRAEGMVITTPQGKKKHPAMMVKNDAMTQSRLLAAELGLTPVSRSRPAKDIQNDDENDSADLGL